MPENKDLHGTRRNFLKTLVLSSAAAVLAACRRPSATDATPTPELIMVKPETDELSILFGQEEQVNIPGLPGYSPDGHTPFFKDESGIHMFITADGKSYLVEGPDFDSLSTQGPVLVPEGQTDAGYEGYTGLCSVIKDDRNNRLIGLYHRELWQDSQRGFPYHADIGLATSHDLGKTWEKKGPVVKGMIYGDYADNKPYGAGQPCAIVKDDQVYVYYVDWNGGKYPDTIHLARAPLADIENPDAWEKHTAQGFIKGSESKPLFDFPDNSKVVYLALPSVSYNAELNSFLMVAETNYGFILSKSADGLNWENFQALAAFPQPQTKRQNNDVWYSYPTLLSDTDTDQFSKRKGWLYYSKGVWGSGPHTPHRKSFRIT